MISTVNQNGNMISDMYSYEYDQLNRLVGMQSYEGNAAGTYSIGNTLGANSSYEYDLDGNLEQLTRHFGLERDDVISYTYPDEVTVGSELRKTSNKLGNITNTGNLPSISSQSSGNYTYDEIGNLISDDGEEIYTIVWTPSGKVAEVIRIANSEKSDLEFRYDAMENRIFKIEKVKNETGDILAPENWKTTFYSRDAQGNVMATYIGNADANENPANLELLELYMYGSSRLGSIDAEMEKPNNLDSDQYIDYFSPVSVSSTTYWPFGLPLEADNPHEYRFGFNGMEKDPEVTGQEGSHYTAAFWEYDTRIGRRWNVDPVGKPWESSYLAFSGNPILLIDPMGDNADGYTVDDDGYIERVDDTGGDEFDVLYDKEDYENGHKEYSEVYEDEKGIKLDKSVMTSETVHERQNVTLAFPNDEDKVKKGEKTTLRDYHYYNLNKQENPEELMRFLTENTGVEWGFRSFSYTRPFDDQVRQGSVLSTGHLHRQLPTYSKLNKYRSVCSFDVSLDIHNHPRGTPFASGEKGDMGAAKVIESYSTKPVFKIMPKGGSTFQYDSKNKWLPDFETLEIVVKAKR